MYTLYFTSDGRKTKILECNTEFDIYHYIHGKHSYSTSHAMQYEGYSVEQDGIDITNSFILN